MGRGQFANEGGAGELLPPGFGLAVIHHKVAVAQAAGGAEVEHHVAHPPIEHDARVAQGAEGNGDRPAGNLVVDDFVPYQNGQRIGPSLSAMFVDDDRIRVRQPVRRSGDRFEARGVQGRNAVLGRASGNDFGQVNGAFGEIGLPTPRVYRVASLDRPAVNGAHLCNGRGSGQGVHHGGRSRIFRRGGRWWHLASGEQESQPCDGQQHRR